MEEQRGHSGVSYVYKVMSWNEHDSQEDIICCTKNDVGTCLPDDFVKALLQVVPESYRLTNMNDEANVSEELEAKLTKLKESLSERTNEGKSYHDIQQQLKKIEQEISKVQADLKKVENSGINN